MIEKSQNDQTKKSSKKVWETPQLTVISAIEDATQSGAPRPREGVPPGFGPS